MNTSFPADTKTILVVDDEDCLRVFLNKLLATEGYNVLLAGNGKQAVEIFITSLGRIDLVLMDITMPVMDGLTAHRKISRVDPNVPILLMSAYNQGTFSHLETCHFIKKPMMPADLLNAIKQLLDNPAAAPIYFRPGDHY